MSPHPLVSMLAATAAVAAILEWNPTLAWRTATALESSVRAAGMLAVAHVAGGAVHVEAGDPAFIVAVDGLASGSAQILEIATAILPVGVASTLVAVVAARGPAALVLSPLIVALAVLAGHLPESPIREDVLTQFAVLTVGLCLFPSAGGPAIASAVAQLMMVVVVQRCADCIGDSCWNHFAGSAPADERMAAFGVSGVIVFAALAWGAACSRFLFARMWVEFLSWWISWRAAGLARRGLFRMVG